MVTELFRGTSFDREARKPLVERALDNLGGVTGGKLDGARVLVTGARGFFGRYVVEALLEMNNRGAHAHPIEIVAADSYAVGNDEARVEEWRNAPNLTLWRCNIAHAGGGLPLIGNRHFTHIWHLAGIASPYWYKKLPEETIAVAVDGTRNMLRAAREHDARFMFTSSSEVYQTANEVPTPESYVGAIPSTNERSCYDVSKLMAETLCYVEALKHGTHTSAIRIHNTFGPGMAEVDRRILPRIASAMKGGREMKVFAKGDHQIHLPTRTYSPAANTLLGFLKVALEGVSMGTPHAPPAHGIYNVGLDTDEITVPQLISRCVKSSGKELAYKLVQPPEHYETEPMRRCPDLTKLRALGWSPCMSLDEGVEHFFKWSQQSYQGID